MPLSALVTGETDLEIRWSLAAPVQRVWQCLTEGPLLSEWLGELVSGGVADGQAFTIDHGQGYNSESTVSSFKPEAELAYSWSTPDEPDSNVSWKLASAGDRTELILWHTGLAGLVGEYRDGWVTHLLFLEAAALGAPVPKAMFWPLHATIEKLAANR